MWLPSGVQTLGMYNLVRGLMSILVCLQCGESFKCKPSRIAAGKGKFCSRKCRTDNSGNLTRLYPKEYDVYCGAKARCKGTQKAKIKRYKERGIEFRFSSFAEFMAELGPRPEGMQVDRIDNDGHYEPGNIRWADTKTQGRNRECTLRFEHNGELKTLAEWAESTGIAYDTLYARISCYGWTFEQAVTRSLYDRMKHV